tara:strand:- start:3 stop:260 length:258 start_codon:yes stop_codon:yes gene_type:complete
LTGRPRLVISSKTTSIIILIATDASFSQIESIQESTASILEAALEAVDMNINKVNLQALTGEQKVQLKSWHQGLQQASTVIRRPT